MRNGPGEEAACGHRVSTEPLPWVARSPLKSLSHSQQTRVHTECAVWQTGMGLKKITRGFHDQLTNQVVLGMILQAEEGCSVVSRGRGALGGRGGEKGKQWGVRGQGRGSGGAFHSPHRQGVC